MDNSKLEYTDQVILPVLIEYEKTYPCHLFPLLLSNLVAYLVFLAKLTF